MKYKDGKFRGFAFIGYQTDAEAGAAKKYLDGTFVGAAIIKVEICNELGESNKKKDKKKEKKESKSDKKKEDCNDDLASAEKALKTSQHSRLGDHCLELKRSTRAGVN